MEYNTICYYLLLTFQQIDWVADCFESSHSMCKRHIPMNRGYRRERHYKETPKNADRKSIKTRSIQRTQTPPRLLPLTCSCDLDRKVKVKTLMSLDVTYFIIIIDCFYIAQI